MRITETNADRIGEPLGNDRRSRARFLRGMGTEKRLRGDLPGALALFRSGLELWPDADGHSDVGVTLLQANDVAGSEYHLRQALALEPDSVKRHAFLPHTLFAAGKLSEAYVEWDWAAKGSTVRTDERNIATRWEPGMTGRVLVYKEQGMGDDLMFASCYPDLIASLQKTDSSLIIETDARLVSLYDRSYGPAEVRPYTWTGPNEVDAAVPAGSLPAVYRPTIESFPRTPYLVPDPELVEQWRTWLSFSGPGPYVGISWRSMLMTGARPLEYPPLKVWDGVLSQRDVTFVNVQYGEAAEHELNRLEREYRKQRLRILRPPIDLTNDLDELAALLSALDLVLAPQNTVAMMASGLGTPTLALSVAPDWPLLGSTTWPWSPMRVALRLPEDDWSGPMSVAARAVRSL